MNPWLQIGLTTLSTVALNGLIISYTMKRIFGFSLLSTIIKSNIENKNEEQDMNELLSFIQDADSDIEEPLILV